jgi:NADH-quinone oxidoreductase subunit N
MLYGLSLLAGVLNSAHLPTMAAVLADKLDSFGSGEIMILVLGGLMVSVGLAFKLSAVPFHFWCPDVFEGAPAEIDAFLSVASKAAALGLLIRVAFGLGHIPADSPLAQSPPPAAHAPVLHGTSAIAPGETPVAITAAPRAAPLHIAPAPATTVRRASVNERLQPVCDFIARLVAFLAVITCTFGNLAAYGQTNIKRLMAYSTIAHAGYMMMAVPAALSVASFHPDGVTFAIAGLAIYVGIYLFMNLGAFAIIAFLRNATGGSEEIDDYRGLIQTAPVYVISMTVICFALVGLPPLAGFIGKFAIFAALIDSWGRTGQAFLLITVIVGGVNTVVSLFYYLRVVRAMIIEPEPDDRTPLAYGPSWFEATYVVAVTVPTVVLFFSWSLLSEWAIAAARSL